MSRHIHQAEDINDVVQQVFLVVTSKLPTFVHSGRAGAFRHWLRNITVNHVRAFWRSRRLPDVSAEADAVLEQLTDPASELSRQWDREHDCHVAHKVLALVEADFRPATWQAFCRLVLDEGTPEGVAAEPGLFVEAVATM